MLEHIAMLINIVLPSGLLLAARPSGIEALLPSDWSVVYRYEAASHYHVDHRRPPPDQTHNRGTYFLQMDSDLNMDLLDMDFA